MEVDAIPEIHHAGSSHEENLMAKVKKTDCALLPPCAKTVRNNCKLQRAHYVSIVWAHADTPSPGHGLDPQNYEWKSKNGCYSPDWFEGPALPDHLFQEGELSEDLQSSRPDVASEFDADDSSTEPSWSDDSDNET